MVIPEVTHPCAISNKDLNYRLKHCFYRLQLQQMTLSTSSYNKKAYIATNGPRQKMSKGKNERFPRSEM